MTLFKTFVASAVLLGLADGANAADLARQIPPANAPLLAAYSWTGFYAGLETTYAYSGSGRIVATGLDAPNAAAIAAGTRVGVANRGSYGGFANVGGGLGFNYQLSPGSGLIVGANLSVDWTATRKNTVVEGITGNDSFYRTRLNYVGTATGRIGYAVDRFMVYGLGGFAFGQTDNRASFFGPAPTFTPLYVGGERQLRTGYAFGGGAEYAIPADSVLGYFSVARLLGINATSTIKAEYVRYNLGDQNIYVANTGAGNGVGHTVRFRNDGNLIRVGFNYKFGGAAPAVAVNY